MTPRVRLHPLVPADLPSILDYLAKRSGATADRFGAAVESTLDALAALPGKGSPKHFRGRHLSDLRTWHVSGFPNYLIIYYPIPDGIRVVGIVHGSRNLLRLLKERLP